jgi:RNA recognition motif-containing protein
MIMNNKLFVASLSFKMSDQDLADIFLSVGRVISAKIIIDELGRSKGFGFVEMSTEEEALAAIAQLNGTIHFGRAIVVNKQRPRVFRDNSATPNQTQPAITTVVS